MLFLKEKGRLLRFLPTSSWWELGSQSFDVVPVGVHSCCSPCLWVLPSASSSRSGGPQRGFLGRSSRKQPTSSQSTPVLGRCLLVTGGKPPLMSEVSRIYAFLKGPAYGSPSSPVLDHPRCGRVWGWWFRVFLQEPPKVRPFFFFFDGCFLGV